jgi:nucleotide-binding universal stress UspA family protein
MHRCPAMNDMTILHPTDFSKDADAAEIEAVRLARALGGELLLLHVATEAPLYGEHVFAMNDVKRVYDAQARWVEDRLAERALAHATDGVPARWRRSIGTPHAEIVRIAREERAAYIVMGSRGLSGLERFMVGSVADRVVRTAPCPVLTVRSEPATR